MLARLFFGGELSLVCGLSLIERFIFLPTQAFLVS